MALPTQLLAAIAAVGGGKIAVVTGAGCSVEAPTSIPTAAACSQVCYDSLVADGVLDPGDCADPRNLSALADAVVAKTGGQHALVEKLAEHYNLKAATPNEGHILAAAMLAEGALAAVVTLNFDLALSTAIAQLGVGEVVGIIDGPNEFGRQVLVNLYYLHRNANEANPDKWVLTTAALETEWKAQWEDVIVRKVLAAPVVVFAGLGSPADALTASATLIHDAIPQGRQAYLVGPGLFADSDFAKALSLAEADYVQAGWCQFMSDLSERLVEEQLGHILASASVLAKREGIHDEDLRSMLNRVAQEGLPRLGALRANLMLDNRPYLPDVQQSREQIADLLLGTALIAREAGAIAKLTGDGVIEFHRDDRVVTAYVLASGSGTKSCATLEAELSGRARRHRLRETRPSGAIVAATRDGYAAATPPNDVVRGNESGSIVAGESVFAVFHVEAIRQDISLCGKVAP